MKGEIVDVRIPEDLKDRGKVLFGAWLTGEGDFVEPNQPIAEVQTDKAALEIPAPAAGVVHQKPISPGAPVAPGQVIGTIVPEAGEVRPTKRENLEATPPRASGSGDLPVGMSPAVARLIRKHGIDSSRIAGTGRGGRITHADVLAYLGRDEPVSARAPKPSSSAPPLGASQLVPHSTIRRQIARHMEQSVRAAPHVTSVFSCDLEAILAHREMYRPSFREAGFDLTYTAYFVCACARGLKKVPVVNSRWTEEALELFDDCNIGIGTSLGDAGLVVPVIHRAQLLDLRGVAQRLFELTERARAGNLRPEEVANGTFTISNHGVSGSLLAAPIIINQPQSAILGIGKAERRPVVFKQGGKEEIRIRTQAYVTLTLDHRVLDAHQANEFLREVIREIEGWPLGKRQAETP